MKNDLTNIINFGYVIRNVTMVCYIEMVILIPTISIIICDIYKGYKMIYKIRYTMTYTKFKKKIEEIGLVYCNQGSGVCIYNFNKHRLNPIASVSEDKLCTIATPYVEDNKLFKLCYELSKTPINKKGELK